MPIIQTQYPNKATERKINSKRKTVRKQSNPLCKSHSNLLSPNKRERNKEGYIWDLATSTMSTRK
jgi:hypothetical protein